MRNYSGGGKTLNYFEERRSAGWASCATLPVLAIGLLAKAAIYLRKCWYSSPNLNGWYWPPYDFYDCFQ
jgi:hypothetical protein